MKFRAKFYSMRMPKRKVKDIIFNSLIHSNELAGNAWLDATVRGIPIPTWGGASRATFQKLAKELGTSVPIGPLRGPSTVASGVAHSAGSGVVETKSDMYVGFVYETTLQGLIYNEYNKAVAGPYPQPWSNNVRNTPYKFQASGKVAWKHYASKVKLPDPYEYLIVRKM